MKKILTILLILLIPTPIAASYRAEIFSGNPVMIMFDSWRIGYEYKLEVDKMIDNYYSLVYESDWREEKQIDFHLEEEGSYKWKLYIRQKGKDCSQPHQCYIIEMGYFDFYNYQYVIEDEEESIIEDENDISTQEENRIEEDFIEAGEENTPITWADEGIEVDSRNERDEEVMGVEDKREQDVCYFEYNKTKKSFTLESCYLSKPQITKAQYSESSIGNNKDFIVEGNYTSTMEINIKNVRCQSFRLFDFNTWFACKKEFVDEQNYTVSINYIVLFQKNGNLQPQNFFFKKDSFFISSNLEDIPKGVIFYGNFSLKHDNEWLDQRFNLRKDFDFEKVDKQNSGIYRFPFNKIIYVNQWHGCTVYQCPHTGIDFASVREKIYAIGDGEVISVIDSYPKDACRHAGKSIVMRHENGQHSVYMHLRDIFVKRGERIKKGKLIAISGNTGSFNCQPLGYHLHFELRNGRTQATHTDPVPYINVNWDLVKTNKANIFPGRLSGDNPHPNF